MNGAIGRDVGSLVRKLDAINQLSTAKLYQEEGVYNFYLQDAAGWLKLNLDSGAAETVLVSQEGGSRPAQR